jgi:hypothetical protein
MWGEYDAAAEWCAKRRIAGTDTEKEMRLPELLSADVHALIDADPGAFAARVRETAYALAMERNGYDGPAGSNREDV